jgi:hypothetical protein
MIVVRRNILNILLFVLWIGLALSLTTAKAEETNDFEPNRAIILK